MVYARVVKTTTARLLFGVVIYLNYTCVTYKAIVSCAAMLNANREERDNSFNISNLCLVTENIGICDYSHCCNIDSCVGSGSNFTHVELRFEIQFSTKGSY